MHTTFAYYRYHHISFSHGSDSHVQGDHHIIISHVQGDHHIIEIDSTCTFNPPPNPPNPTQERLHEGAYQGGVDIGGDVKEEIAGGLASDDPTVRTRSQI